MIKNIPNFDVKIYKGENSISLTKTDSNILTSIQTNPKMDRLLIVANIKQYISYHLIRIISDGFKYMDKDIYDIINGYVYSLPLDDFLNMNGGEQALKLNIVTEIYKISELLYYYGKPLVIDINNITEETDALITKIFRSIM